MIGTVLLFIICIVFTVIVTAYVLTYVAYCVLVTVQDTAAGLDEVVWPEEPLYDKIGRALPLVGVCLIWAAPAGILTRALRNVWLPDDPTLRFLLLAAPGLWLF